ncbi:MAG: PAS domain-containing protein [Verrucomicrobiae bacterium]|nr:PAS domain-containing protein [Verrucomicrobiae bacterium]
MISNGVPTASEPRTATAVTPGPSPSVLVEILVIIALALLAAFLGWRYWAILRGLREVDDLIKRESSPKPSSLKAATESAALANLSRTVLNHITEANLTRDLESTQRQFLEALLNEIDDALLIVDENSEIRFSNRAAKRLFPSEHSHLGRPLIEVCLDHRIVDTVRLAGELGSKTQDRFNRRSLSGEDRSEYIYLIEAEPLSSINLGQGAWVLIRDVTLQMETERIRRDFVANASHELRTPLSIISGYLEMLDIEESDPPIDAETLRRCVPTMRKHADRLGRIVDDMLTISKLEGYDELLNRETFDLGDCIRESLDHLQPVIEEKHARVHLDLPVSATMVGDRFYWDQIFFNLVENALKQNLEPGLNVNIRLNPDQGRYRIEVIDDGIGIPAADLPHIFKRFYRVQKDHSQLVKGTGLGLSIVKRAVEAHHGNIRVQSRPGQQTAFIIEVPQPPSPKLHESNNHAGK